MVYDLDYFRTTHRVDWPEVKSHGYTTIPVLEFLWGEIYDELVLAWIHTCKPTGVRVTRGECTCDASIGRVTVFINEFDIIKKIVQEVQVAIPDYAEHGHGLSILTQKKIGKEKYEKHFGWPKGD